MAVIQRREVERQWKRTSCFLSLRRELCVGRRSGCGRESGELAEGAQRQGAGRGNVEAGGPCVDHPVGRMLLWSVLQERQLPRHGTDFPRGCQGPAF